MLCPRHIRSSLAGVPACLGAFSFGPSALLLLSLIAANALTGCGGPAQVSQPQSSRQTVTTESLCARQWLLKELRVDGRDHRLSMFWQKMWRDRPYLTCDKLGFVRGSAGSNPYLGKFSLDDNGSIQWLKPPEISRLGDRRESSKLEEDFLLALPRVDHVEASGETLTLTGGDGTRLQFKQTRELPPAP
ncbi:MULTISPECIES: META domain-containing protein [Microbulbifer]|uniref:META domain-containing protein n=1 Tax=Microbulbifer celer TaxID=435905 RepID=A0ABW3UBX0_9GAMM|nr:MULTISPECIES: META domain-containing protein [Microbulbifer]UFN57247.1 META domain-containing protein [Microbulbifer celer]